MDKVRDTDGFGEMAAGLAGDLNGELQARELTQEALFTAARIVLEGGDFATAARVIFDAAREITGGQSGYVALLSADGRENEVLFLESGGRPCSVDESLPMPIRGLRAESYKSGRAVCDNNFMASHWVGFMPSGHVRLTNVLFAPLNIGGNTVGLMGLANKSGDFSSDDLRHAEILGRSAAVVLHYCRNMEALRDSEGRVRGALEEQQRLLAQLVQAQKMESVGRLAGGVAHDFNNMLGVIQGYVEIALTRLQPSDPLFADLMEIRKAARRSADITRQLLAFARKQKAEPKLFDLNEAVGGMLKMLRRLLGEDIDLTWHPCRQATPVLIDPSHLDQVLVNLCVNARDAMVKTGRLVIETSLVEIDADYCADHAGFIPGRFVCLAVSDSGCGMDKATLEKIFEPFFTTKEQGKGTGLGLATVYGIVKQNEGFVNVYSEPGHGSCFRIYFPLRDQAATAIGPEKQDRQAVTAAAVGKTVLLVEDEPAILKMTSLLLEMYGYKVLAASRPSEALSLAEQNPGAIDLLITDVVMPEMDGRSLACRLVQRCPGLRCLFMSGYTQGIISGYGVKDNGGNGGCFLQKPFGKDELAAKVLEALKQPPWQAGSE